MPQKTMKEMIAESVDKVIADMDAVTKAVKDLRKEGVVANERTKFRAAYSRLSAACGTEGVGTASAASGAASGTQRVRLTEEEVLALNDVLVERIKAAGKDGIKTVELRSQYLDSDVVTANEDYKDRFQSRLTALEKAQKIKKVAVEKGNPKKGSIITLKS
ncbi:MAG: hypothetical protein GY920_01620 [Aliivibrio sp.]|nr:hypothetical protein [Aliivibrio sp.]